MKDIVRTTVRLPSGTQQQIDSLARVRGITAAAMIRHAVGDYLHRAEALAAAVPTASGADLTRIALTTEFTQASVDVLLRELAPGKREEVLLTVEQRMGQFHGQK